MNRESRTTESLTPLTPVTAPPLRGSDRFKPRHWPSGISSALRSPPKWLLLSLSVAVIVVTGLLKQEDSIVTFLLAHRLPLWLIHPLGIPLVLFWVVLYVSNETWVRVAAIVERRRWIHGQRTILGKFAGNIEKLTEQLDLGDDRRLPESEARQLVCSFLARIVDYGRIFVPDTQVELRACCLRVVSEFGYDPKRDPHPGTRPTFLEAWVYDSPHPHAGGSKIPWGQPLAGVVAERKKAFILNDTLSSECAPFFADAEYRSVIGFPLLIGRDRLIGVVTIDASQDSVFSKGSVGSQIEGAVSPILAAIALAIDSLAN